MVRSEPAIAKTTLRFIMDAKEEGIACRFFCLFPWPPCLCASVFSVMKRRNPGGGACGRIKTSRGMVGGACVFLASWRLLSFLGVKTVLEHQEKTPEDVAGLRFECFSRSAGLCVTLWLMNLKQHLEVAVSAVQEASAVCRRVQADLVNAGTLEKGDKSPVTVADFAAQAVVCARLGAAFPGLPVVGEEAGDDLRGDAAAALLAQVAGHAGMDPAATLAAIDRGGWTPDGSADVYWTLDPIDGTKGFLRGEQYAVALGLIAKGQVVLGVLGCPNLDGGLLMTGGDGVTPQRLSVAGDSRVGDAVAVSATADSNDARFCESVESGHSDQGASAKIAAALGITKEPYRIDSQCKYAAVARGDADIYLRLPTRPGYEEKIWDHAAGLAVVEAAGGRVTDIDGQPLDFTQGRTLKLNRGVVATNGALHAAVIAAIAEV